MARKIAEIDDTQIRRDVDSHKGSGKFFKLQEGTNYVRFLPPLEGLVQPGTYYGLHHEHGIKTEGAYRSIHCLEDKKIWCPMCALAQHFKAQPDEESRKHARNCFSRAKYFANAITGKLSRDKSTIDADEDQGIVLLQFSNGLFEKCDDHRHSDWGDFTSPTEGYWLNITGKGEGQSRRYPNVSPSRKSMGALPEWVNFDEAHNLISEELIPYKKTTEMVMILVDRYADLVPVEEILKKSQQAYKAARGK